MIVSCVFVTFRNGVLGQVYYVIVWIPDISFFLFVIVMWLFLTVLCVGLPRVIVVFTDHTQLLFDAIFIL